MSTIYYSLPLDKKTSDGKCPVVILYQLHGDRTPFRPGIKLYPANWDQGKQEAIYIDKKAAKVVAPGIHYDLLLTAREAEDINLTLKGWEKHIADIEKRLELDQVQYTGEMVVEKLKDMKGGKTKKVQPSKFVYDYIDRYVEENKATRVPGSLTVYTSLKSHLQSFEQRTRTKVRFDSIDHNFFRQFQNYLVTEGGLRKTKTGERIKEGLTNTTAAKQLSTLKTFLGYAKKDGITISDKYDLFKIEKQEGAVITLTDEEFTALLQLERVAKYQLTDPGVVGDTVTICAEKGKEPICTYIRKASDNSLSELCTSVTAAINDGTLAHGYSAWCNYSTDTINITAPEHPGELLYSGSPLAVTINKGGAIAGNLRQLVAGSTTWHVRNAFCFGVTSALRYSDLKKLSWENIRPEEIIIHVTKKKKLVPHIIPLTPYSRAILNRYTGQLRPLHVISNQRMNDYLKGNDKRSIRSICEMADITEPTKVVRYRGAITEEFVVPKYRLIGVHQGRKSFCTLSLERGMSAEETMGVSGHESYKSFSRYVNVTDQRKKKAMGKAWAA